MSIERKNISERISLALKKENVDPDLFSELEKEVDAAIADPYHAIMLGLLAETSFQLIMHNKNDRDRLTAAWFNDKAIKAIIYGTQE